MHFVTYIIVFILYFFHYFYILISKSLLQNPSRFICRHTPFTAKFFFCSFFFQINNYTVISG